MNMDGDLTSRDMNNGERSNKDNPRLNNHNGHNINLRFSNPNNSALSLRASDPGESHNIHSLKENLLKENLLKENPKEGMQDIESRIPRS
jgi:hypothetical protein